MLLGLSLNCVPLHFLLIHLSPYSHRGQFSMTLLLLLTVITHPCHNYVTCLVQHTLWHTQVNHLSIVNHTTTLSWPNRIICQIEKSCIILFPFFFFHEGEGGGNENKSFFLKKPNIWHYMWHIYVYIEYSIITWLVLSYYFCSGRRRDHLYYCCLLVSKYSRCNSFLLALQDVLYSIF